MRTLFLPPLIFTIYSFVLLSVVWLISPRTEAIFERDTVCITEVEKKYLCNFGKYPDHGKDGLSDVVHEEKY